MQGTLRQTKGEFVLVDSKWYKVLEPKYIPKEDNIAVEFETSPEDAGVIKFIKRAGAVVGKGAASTAKSSSYTPSSTPRDSSKTGTSIVRQVIFKGAVELVNGNKYPTIDAAMEDLKKLESYLMGD